MSGAVPILVGRQVPYQRPLMTLKEAHSSGVRASGRRLAHRELAGRLAGLLIGSWRVGSIRFVKASNSRNATSHPAAAPGQALNIRQRVISAVDWQSPMQRASSQMGT